jgi:hypothetical protein
MASVTKHNITGVKKTDDEVFAEIEAQRIDKKMDKELAKTMKIWEKDEKKDKNEKDINIRKKLLEIRREIRETKYDTLDQKEHYFSKKHV